MSDAARVRPEKIRCDACPVLCFIAEGKSGACDRYANHSGELVRLDPLTVIESGAPAVAFLDQGENVQNWDGDIVQGKRTFVTAVGAGTTYPDYKPAPFIVSQEVDGADMVTVVTEGIYSYCGVKVKIDTDRFIGHERAVVRVKGEAIGRGAGLRRVGHLLGCIAVGMGAPEGAGAVVFHGARPLGHFGFGSEV